MFNIAVGMESFYMWHERNQLDGFEESRSKSERQIAYNLKGKMQIVGTIFPQKMS